MLFIDVAYQENLEKIVKNGYQVFIIPRFLEALSITLERVQDNEISELLRSKQVNFRGCVQKTFSNRARSIVNTVLEDVSQTKEFQYSAIKQEFRSFKAFLKQAAVEGIEKGSSVAFIPSPVFSTHKKSFVHEFIKYHTALLAGDTVRRSEEIERNFVERAIWIAEFYLRGGKDWGVDENLKKIRELFVSKYNITVDFDEKYSSFQRWEEHTEYLLKPASSAEALFVLAIAYKELEKNKNHWGSELVRQIRVVNSMESRNEDGNLKVIRDVGGRCFREDGIIYLACQKDREEQVRTTQHEFAHLHDYVPLDEEQVYFPYPAMLIILESSIHPKKNYLQGQDSALDRISEREAYAGHASLQGNPEKFYSLARNYSKFQEKGQIYADHVEKVDRFFKIQHQLRRAVKQKADIRTIRILCREWVKQGKAIQHPSIDLFKKGLEIGMDKKFLKVQMDNAEPHFTSVINFSPLGLSKKPLRAR